MEIQPPVANATGEQNDAQGGLAAFGLCGDQAEDVTEPGPVLGVIDDDEGGAVGHTERGELFGLCVSREEAGEPALCAHALGHLDEEARLAHPSGSHEEACAHLSGSAAPGGDVFEQRGSAGLVEGDDAVSRRPVSFVGTGELAP